MPVHHFKDIEEVHAWMAAHLAVPYEERSHVWDSDLYNLAPLCFYEAVTLLAGKDERQFIAARLCGGDIMGRIAANSKAGHVAAQGLPETIMDFSRLAHACAVQGLGVAIMPYGKNSAPQALLHFGCMWSYHAFHHIGGPPMMVRRYSELMNDGGQDPMQRQIPDAETVSFGFPSDEIFPADIRAMIAGELKSAVPDSMPDFLLKSDERQAMPYSIAVQGVAAAPGAKETLREKLLWYMPPYLPLEIL